MPEAAHAVHPLSPDIGCKHWFETVPPQPHCLVADINPPLEQQVLDVAQRQQEADLHHAANRMISGEELK